MGDQRNISSEKERWDAPFSPQKKPSKYTHFRNQTYMKNQEEEQAKKRNLCLKCETKHPQKEFPLNRTSVCHIFIGNHILPQEIQKDPTKIEVIIGHSSPTTLPPPDP